MAKTPFRIALAGGVLRTFGSWCFTCALAAMIASNAFGQQSAGQNDQPRLIKSRRTKPIMAWSAKRIEADASAVPAASPNDPRVQSRGRSLIKSLSNQPTPNRREMRAVASRQTQTATIRQVGYLDETPPNCGPICDCDACCGPAVIHDPACGLEPGCGCEPGCGLEAGYIAGGHAYIGEPVCGIDGPCGTPGCDSCGGGMFMEPGCGCEGDCDGSCDSIYCRVDSFPLFLPILHIDWNRFAFFAGTQGFKGPINYPQINANGDREGSGSFGYFQGFNEGRNLRPWIGADLSAQFGLRATQANLQGESFADGQRTQIFLTTGLFRRVDYGLQYGLVVDYVNEDWYHNIDVVQLRGELSWKASACHAFGFQFMAGVDDARSIGTVTDDAGATFDVDD
ncbi:MAG: DUF6666 family protein, partial [Planctomycetota bacterium]